MRSSTGKPRRDAVGGCGSVVTVLVMEAEAESAAVWRAGLMIWWSIL